MSRNGKPLRREVLGIRKDSDERPKTKECNKGKSLEG